MSLEQSSRFTDFEFTGNPLGVEYQETGDVVPGVQCDVYLFTGDSSKDLGIIHMQPGSRTNPQRVLYGERTIEGYLFGKGTLTIRRVSGELEVFTYDESTTGFPYQDVNVGDVMHWEADETGLVAYEICIPPYEDGRFEVVVSSDIMGIF